MFMPRDILTLPDCIKHYKEFLLSGGLQAAWGQVTPLETTGNQTRADTTDGGHPNVITPKPCSLLNNQAWAMTDQLKYWTSFALQFTIFLLL
jgi:hypothetical protein